MIILRIHGNSVDANDESTITRTINSFKAKDMAVCVQINIKTPGIDVLLTTDACGPSGGSGRQATAQEQALFDLWRRHDLQTGRFAGGQLIAFLKKLS